jgi:diguanylate cyclase (GGDEF)-like protein
MESDVDEQVRTSYRGLLERLARGGYLDPEEDRCVRSLLERSEEPVLAQASHDFVRRLVRTGRLHLETGSLDEPCSALTAADARRGQLYHLPVRPELEPGAIGFAIDPRLGPPPLFSHDDLWTLFLGLGTRAFASVEEAADLRTVLIAILDLWRRLLEFPTALAFTEGLTLPPGIARGPRATVLGSPPPRLAAPVAAAAPVLPPAWGTWVRRALRTPEEALYLTDFGRLDERVRPAERGCALLVPLPVGEDEGRVLVAAIAPEPLWFHEERRARLRALLPHVRRMLEYAVRLQNIVAHDFLTRVYNRASFEDQLTRAIASATRRSQCFALLIVDIDDFKLVNTRYGYDAGDAVLRTIAEQLTQALRSTDVLARYGGEEFAVILAPDLSGAEAQQISERLRAAVAECAALVPTLQGGRQAIRVTVSIGGALSPQHGRHRDELWLEANRMLVEAKADGKNRVRFPWTDAPRGEPQALPGPPAPAGD